MSAEAGVRCDNCGRTAGPTYCPHCGQELESRRGPLVTVVREMVSDWLTLDSRLLRSLRALLRPGRLTELYLAGKRAPFVRPFRLYLLASLLLFSTILTLDTPDASGYAIYIGGELVTPASSDGVQRTLSLWSSDSALGRWLIEVSGDRVERLRSLPPQEVLDRLFAGWRRSLPLALIVFVPFLALALKALYHPLRRTTRERAVHTLFVDHLVFSLHFQSALFLMATAIWLLTRLAGLELGGSVVAYVAGFVLMLMIYLPAALRRFYRESWRRTAVKSVIVLFVYSQLLGATIWISALIGIWDV